MEADRGAAPRVAPSTLLHGVGRPSEAFRIYREALPDSFFTGFLERWEAGIGKSEKESFKTGIFSLQVVTWLMIFQRLHSKGTQSVAAKQLQCGSVRALLPRCKRVVNDQISPNPSGYCRARNKLPAEFAQEVADRMFAYGMQTAQPVAELGRPMFLLDGTTLRLAHTVELVKAFPPNWNQHGTSHWPLLRVLVAHDVVSGLATRPAWGAVNPEPPEDAPTDSGRAAKAEKRSKGLSEQVLSKSVIDRLPQNAVVVGDINFGVFSVAHYAIGGGRDVLLRLSEARARKINSGFVPPVGTDRKVRWEASKDDCDNNPGLTKGDWVEGRLLAFRVPAGDGKTEKVFIFTPLALAPEQILKLYGYRWNVETDLRALKREVRIHTIEVRTRAMVEKELLLAVSAYNVVRMAMNEAGLTLGIRPRDFSFSQTQDVLEAFGPAFAAARSEEERQCLCAKFLRSMAACKLPKRSRRRSFPRAVWSRSSPFPAHQREAAPKTQ